MRSEFNRGRLLFVFLTLRYLLHIDVLLRKICICFADYNISKTARTRNKRLKWPCGRGTICHYLVLASVIILISILILAIYTSIIRSFDLVSHDTPQNNATSLVAVRTMKKRWYFTSSRITHYSDGLRYLQELWPRADLPSIDRIENQLLFQPTRIVPVKEGNSTSGLKIIFVPNDVKRWFAEEGRGTFLKDKCPVNTCFLTNDSLLAKRSDAIIFDTSNYGFKVINSSQCAN